MNDVPQANPAKLFVGNLPFKATEEDVRNLFAEFGEIVDLKLITDRMSGRSKGIAFVEFSTAEQAQAAIEGLHEHDLLGRNIVVNVAKPFVPRERRDFDGGGGGRRDFNRSDRGPRRDY